MPAWLTGWQALEGGWLSGCRSAAAGGGWLAAALPAAHRSPCMSSFMARRYAASLRLLFSANSMRLTCRGRVGGGRGGG